MSDEFVKRYGSYALVTGASAGLGEAFAKQIAQRGLNLVLVPRRKEKLEALATSLVKTHGIAVKTVVLDLGREGAAEELAGQTSEIDIGLVVMNAASLVLGRFVENHFETERASFRLNTVGPFEMSHLFGKRLKQRGRGGILFVSSLIGFSACPYQANYAAGMNYITSSGMALHIEMKAAGVDVTVVAPGGMKTEGLQNAGYDFSSVPQMDPEEVAELALALLAAETSLCPER